MKSTYQSEFGKIKSIFIKNVSDAFVNDAAIDKQWKELNFLSKPDLSKARQEYKMFEELLATNGTEVHYFPQDDSVSMDSVYCRDAAIATDPRFADNPARIKNRGALGAIITEQFGKWTCAEAIDRLQAHEIAWGRVSTVPQVAAHPALRTITVTHSDGTVFDVPRPAGRDNFEIGRVPALGEHSAAIRREFAR